MAAESNGVVTIRSERSFDATVEALERLLAERGVKLFAVADHSGEAAQAGLQMPPTKVLIFGSPRAGTPLMLDAPAIALDLPLKVLVAEDAKGVVRVSWNDPEYLRARHGLRPELVGTIAAAGALARAAAAAE